LTTEPLISVIDDDESLRTALVELVGSFGYQTHGFDSAEDFLAQGPVERFACVVTDVQMPGMSGIELKQWLSARHLAIPVIMMTARSEPGLEDSARAAGAICFLRKPFEASTLVDCIESALAGAPCVD
jgi:FixJ family two-component response regulator